MPPKEPRTATVQGFVAGDEFGDDTEPLSEPVQRVPAVKVKDWGPSDVVAPFIKVMVPSVPSTRVPLVIDKAPEVVLFVAIIKDPPSLVKAVPSVPVMIVPLFGERAPE